MSDKIITKGDSSPIINESTVNIIMKAKYENVMERKNKIYIPIFKEMKEVKSKYMNNILLKFETPFLEEILDKQYEYRLDDELLEQFKHLDKLINTYNRLNMYSVAANIIENIFLKGFKDLYGEIIDGEIPRYQGDELVLMEPVEPEEFDNIRMIAYDERWLKKLLNTRSFDIEYLDYDDGYENYTNSHIVSFYEFALAERNKRYSPKRKMIIEWNSTPEVYITTKYSFFDEFNNSQEVKSKENKLDEIIFEIDKLINIIDEKLKYIFLNYEKE